MVLRTTRPVLGADDLHFIIEGLTLVRKNYATLSLTLAKKGEHTQAGEVLEIGSMVDDLMSRLESLRSDIINEMVEDYMAEATAGLPTEADEDIPVPTDEVGTVPMDEYIPDPIDADNPES